MLPQRFTRRLFLFFTVALLLFTGATFLVLLPSLDHLVAEGVESHLNSASELLAKGWDADTTSFSVPRDPELSFRVTVVESNGQVLADTHQSPESMDNHRFRPELVEALNGNRAFAKRHSATLDKPMTYLAMPVSGQRHFQAMRLAINTSAVDSALTRVRSSVIWSFAISSVVGLLLTFLLSRWLSRPLEQLCADLKEGKKPEVRDSWPAEVQEVATALRGQLEAQQRIVTKHRDFVAHASHELRTPVTALSNLLEALEMGAKDEPERRDHFLRRASEQAERLQALTVALLELSAAEHRSGSFETAPAQLIVAGVEAEMSGLVESKNQKLLVHHHQAEIEVPEGPVTRILRCFLENAAEFGPAGSQIELRWGPSEIGVRFEVLDNGPGIPEEYHERVFERFFRVHPDRSREQGGAGLGLAIARHLARICGGHLELRNRPEGGLRALLEVPVQP